MEITNPRFDGKVAIVTGGASGIGAATALRFVREGARVAIADVQDSLGTAVAESAQASGGECIFKHCDVADGEAWQALVETVIASYGRLDVVLCNAYTLVVKPIHELVETEWRRQIDVCLGQVFHAGRTCLPLLKENRGSLVITSSVHALVGLPGHPAYASAKGAIIALTRQLACDYGPEVRVNTVLPGAIDTPAWDGASEDVRQAFSAQVPLKRFGSAHEVAASICFLASEDAAYITGTSLVVDGGWTATRV